MQSKRIRFTSTQSKMNMNVTILGESLLLKSVFDRYLQLDRKKALSVLSSRFLRFLTILVLIETGEANENLWPAWYKISSYSCKTFHQSEGNTDVIRGFHHIGLTISLENPAVLLFSILENVRTFVLHCLSERCQNAENLLESQKSCQTVSEKGQGYLYMYWLYAIAFKTMFVCYQ